MAEAADMVVEGAQLVEDVVGSTGEDEARILWSNPGNPPASIARALGMELRRFSRALHKIKAGNDLSSTDRVIIYRDGSVADVQGEPLGNLHDED